MFCVNANWVIRFTHWSIVGIEQQHVSPKPPHGLGRNQGWRFRADINGAPYFFLLLKIIWQESAEVALNLR